MAEQEIIATHDIEDVPVLSGDSPEIASSSEGSQPGVTSPTTSQTTSSLGKQYFGSPDEYVLIDGSNRLVRSSNFVTSSAGWCIYGDGSVEFNNGVFRGSISASTIDIGGFDATSFHVDVDGNMWLGAATYAAAPFNVSNSGALTATGVTITGSVTSTSGAAGGWVITADALKDASGTVGMSSAVTGGDDIRFWAGDATPASAEFRVTESGALTATSATITGAITADTGYIGGTSGWVIAAGKITSTGIGVATSTGDATYAFWAGDNTPASAEFSVTHAGAIAATSGTIGGWTLTSTTLSSGSGITIDKGNNRISVGGGSPNILIDGTATTVGTSTFASGQAGWRIDGDGSAEFNNIVARGELRSAVFVKDEIHATGGTVLVLSASTLYADLTTVTTPSTSSMDVTDPPSGHAQLFAVNDIVRIKDGSGKDNWLKVTAVSDQTTFYRYTVDKQSGTNGTFYAGTAVVDYKQSTDGFVMLTSDLTNAPYVDIGVSGATPWTSTTAKARLGNLAGITDPYFGSLSGYGLWTDSGYFSGSVNAAAGKIGGWVITASDIKDAAGVVGLSSAVTGGDDIRFWAGDATPGSAEFRVTESGALTASSATITGSITATSGAIGGFTIGSDYVRDAADSFGMASTVTGSDDVRFWAGDTFANRATADFRVTEAGVLTATSATISGSITATGGTIGGFTIDATSLTATAGGNTTTISSGPTAFSAGPTGTPSVTITQAGVLTATGAVINGSPILNQDIYGDGSDGTVTISTDTTLTSDMFYDSLTIALTGTDVSSPITGATAGDGSATRTSANSVFSTIRSSATGTATDAGVATTNIPTIVAGTTSSRYSTITRGMIVFPTSGIPDGATITSATLQLYVTAKSDQMSQSVSIVTRTDPTTIASADYDIANWTMTKQATDVTIASVTTSAYNTWTLNATGLASISKTGSSVFGVVMSGDADNSAPTWSSGAVASITYNTADNGSNAPVLTVSYSYTPTLNPGGYRIHVKDTLTVNGIISRAGNAGTAGGNGTAGTSAGPTAGVAGTAGAAGAAHADGSIKGSVAGTAGTAGANGVSGSNYNPLDGLNSSASTAGTSVAKSLTSANGSAGGAGGAGGLVDSPVSDGGTAGAPGSAGTVSGTVYNKPNTAFAAWLLQDFLPSTDNLRSSAGSTGGTGGASGGEQTSSYTTSRAASGGGGGGGGAGSAGGIVVIFARTIVIGSAGSVSVSGGNGGNGGNAGTSASQIGTGYAAAGGSGGGGGGAGGSGGVLILVYSSLTNSGTITYAGGTGGTAGTKSVASLSGSGVTPVDGVNGSAGSNGSAGKLIQLQV